MKSQSKYELLAINYLTDKAIDFITTEEVKIWSGAVGYYTNTTKPMVKEKHYTPDIAFTLKNIRYFIEFKGYISLFYKGSYVLVEDRKYMERKPLILNYCFLNNIVFKEFASTKKGVDEFIDWFNSL